MSIAPQTQQKHGGEFFARHRNLYFMAEATSRTHLPQLSADLPLRLRLVPRWLMVAGSIIWRILALDDDEVPTPSSAKAP